MRNRKGLEYSNPFRINNELAGGLEHFQPDWNRLGIVGK